MPTLLKHFFAVFGFIISVLLTISDTANPQSVVFTKPERNQVNGYYGIINGQLALDGSYIQCSIKGWKTQTLYYRHNLPVLAENCVLVPFSH